MPSKEKSPDITDIIKILKFMQKNIDGRFDRVDTQFVEVFGRLDRIEFQATGQERRISTLEDRGQVVATKLGLDFRKL